MINSLPSGLLTVKTIHFRSGDTQRPLIAFFPLVFFLSWYPFILGKTHLVHTILA